MSDLLRESPVGQMLRWATRNRILQYPEEKPGFQIPESYQQGKAGLESPSTTGLPSPAAGAEKSEEQNPAFTALTTAATQRDVEAEHGEAGAGRMLSEIMSRADMSQVNTRAELEAAYTNATKQETIRQQQSRPIVPATTSDGRILVDWYTTDDPANPQNWSRSKKSLVVLQIYLYTLSVYIGSAIYTPSVPYVSEQFGVAPTVASLGLSMYVLGYGLGPLLFSPLSEIPVIGRNPPYMLTFGIFVILCVPTALVNSFPGLIVLRFLQGFFGSPCLATGGASIGDIFSLMELPYYLCGWAAFATAGPALGPLVSGFSVPYTNWHWSLWEILWLAGPVFLSLLFFLPETSSSNILLRRAARLRKSTGNSNLLAQSEIDQSKLTLNEIVVGNLWRPFQINALDPAVLFTSVYIALIYGIFYSFFEVFPIVYGTGLPGKATRGYGMNAGEMGLIFLVVSVGVAIAIPAYFWYLRYVFEPNMRRNGLGAPEERLIPAMYVSVLAPIGLFIFAWTGNSAPEIHWIVPTIGILFYVISIFIVFQCLFIYIPMSYPQYAASLFAGNDAMRSSLAAGAIHFASPLFHNLGVGKGTSLLGGLCIMGVVGILVLYHYGATLRGKSRFAAK